MFDMAKFFNKESPIDTLYTLHTEATICNKDYRIWYKLNENARVSVTTSVRETDREIIPNSIGQGSFGAALASSLNIGCAVNELFDSEHTSEIGYLKLNYLILQDDISKKNDTMEQARNGAERIDDMLKKKQLSVNYEASSWI